MSLVSVAAENLANQLRAGLAGTAGVAVMGQQIANYPAVVIGPPVLSGFTLNCPDPTDATFPVLVVVKESERALEQLWELVPQVVTVLHEETDGVVTGQAEPSAFRAGGTDLPAYYLEAAMPLNE